MVLYRWYVLGSVFFFISVASLAQPAPEAKMSVEDECQLTVPGKNGETHPSETKEGTADQSLTDALDPCNGVIAPPPVGDQELTIPPPAGGETPVIPPGALPGQQP